MKELRHVHKLSKELNLLNFMGGIFKKLDKIKLKHTFG